MPGTLYVVATPIGNLSDLSPRARETLASADVIAAEDTRHTSALLHAVGLSRPMLSLHEHNERDRVADVLARLARGERIALVSDAGTPLVSDPGYVLVRAAISAAPVRFDHFALPSIQPDSFVPAAVSLKAMSSWGASL